MDVLYVIQQEFKLKKEQVYNTVKLIDEGNTIPFIARYRKELTESLNDQLLRQLYDRLLYLRNLEDRVKQIRNLIQEQGNMTQEIDNKLTNAITLTEVEDIYRPFKPKRRTKATIAKEKGLQHLADIIFAQNILCNVEDVAQDFISEDNGVYDIEDAISGACDIVAEIISDNSEYRAYIRKEVLENAFIVTKSINTSEDYSVYEMYYDFEEAINKVAPYRILAINRAEKENIISVKISLKDEEILRKLDNFINKKNKYTDATLMEIIEDSYKRLIFPSIEREIRAHLTDIAQETSIKIFGENLKQLLLQPPVKNKVVLAFDPGYRTGCKIACVDETGKVLYTDVVYCTPPQNKTEESKQKLIPIIKKFGVNIIAIGNGTASRETEFFVADMIKQISSDIYYVIVNEAGASIYSASKLGAWEFPDYDVAIRSAISIARRLQDPLAELVKIDPKNIGIGQYQHDMNQKRLGECLGWVVENCVNTVGVDLNTASIALLSYISGISESVAKNIIDYRNIHGKFIDIHQLLDVKKLGPKTFEQCAGFLRILESKEILDSTGVHPESYGVVKKLLKLLKLENCLLQDINFKEIFLQIDIEQIAEALNIGVPTLKDIIKELEKPGRDPRDDIKMPILRQDVISLEDLKEGMILQGIVRNIIDFGVFVDIGVHHDGLVHISEISDLYTRHPLDAVTVGQVVDVKVKNIDQVKKRIALTMRGL